jgi:ribosomal protein S27E
MDAVDGNAIGGLLQEIFDSEMTTTMTVCGNCGTARQVGELTVYAHAPGTVVRCPSCDSVLMVFVKLHDRTCVDLMGLASLG